MEQGTGMGALAIAGQGDIPLSALRSEPDGARPHDTISEMAAAFARFLAGLLPTLADRRRLGAGADQLARRLAPCLDLDGTWEGATGGFFVGGALARRTAILSAGDAPTVDLFLVLASGPAPLDAAVALDTVARAARSLGIAPLLVGPRAVVLRHDGLSHALTPTRRVGDRLEIPGRDAEGRVRWIPSDPLAEVVAPRTLAMVHGREPGQLLALLKAWRHHNRAPLSGYALEMLVQAFFRDGPAALALGGRMALPDLFETFMAWGRNVTPGSIPLPGGGRRLSVGDAWHGLAQAAYWRAVGARRLVTQGDAQGAGLLWREILGAAFPVPRGCLETVGPSH
jgi:hypothetical protein